MLPDSRLGSRAVRGLQQHINGEIERRLRLLEVSERELALTGGEMALRLGDQIRGGVVNGLGGSPDDRWTWNGRRGVVLTDFGALLHPASNMLTPKAAATGSSVRMLIRISTAFRLWHDRNYRDVFKPSGTLWG